MQRIGRTTNRKYSRNSTGKSIRVDLNLTLEEMFERFISFKQTEGLQERTLNDYYMHFTMLMDYIGKDITRDEITEDLFLDYSAYMIHERGLAPHTVNLRIRTMRAFIRYCFKEGWIDVPIHEKFKPIKVEEDTLESLTPAELKVLFSVVDTSTYAGFRDLVMLHVLLDTMVRISELLAMKRENVDLKTGLIKLNASGTKTKKYRVVPLSSKTIKLLQEYIAESADFNEDTLFLTYDGRPMNDHTFRAKMKEYGELAGIKNKRVSPHTLRHSGALLYILNGGDPFSLQACLGHRDLSMVRKYIQMTNTDVKRQHNQFSPLKSVFK
ncbi:tyrosine-type recombinase/integrase [Schinkia azotoformans]|uniref:tyrosine-type recombinase/integrase n=1 Tax=Schinkia azotoformans TaxID=1454 RepID=UPI002DB977A0|nr:tyrosine-type recombinase/integrase [Schinkia azotoformans]MEC1768315.1 tyrosine-type recombinase/integrase [Schinkia azotoformans]